jgi:hypothetical protein
MTAPADRCEVCDRPECSANYRDEVIRGSPTLTGHLLACHRNRVDWRARCQAAEAEALASRSLLREIEGSLSFEPPRSAVLALAARIRSHLAGKP